MKVRAFLSIGFATANREETLDLPDDLTEAEIEECVEEWKNDYVEWSYERIEDR